MNIFRKIIYFFLSIKERTLAIRLGKYLKHSSVSSASKTFMDSNTIMTLNAETQKNAALVKKNIEEILKSNNNDPCKLLAYIENHGTKICKLKNADKILNLISEEEGLITEHCGFEGLYLNIVTKNGFRTKSEPMFIMREGEISPFYMIHQFYKWYALKCKLPGFDYKSQQLFKKYLYSKKQLGMENLSLDRLTGLKEAIARDKEATDYAYNIAREEEGSRKAFNKLSDGEANI
ncbi:MAG: hypothetical protein LBK53_05765 [Heliobacteriaceae bacterium]|jgi:hypothetical protein|nr:hypothetical protein [Heliobacteriaceae bacterium]